MGEAPRRIYLQLCEDDAKYDLMDQETWCEVRINDDDVEYVRSDIHHHLVEVSEYWLKEGRFLVPHCDEYREALKMLTAAIAKAKEE